MQLDDVQKQAVKQWVSEGSGLSDIQKRLASEFKITMTYMDVRFLMIDLGLDVKERAAKSTAAAADLSKIAPAKQNAPEALDHEGADDLGAGDEVPGLGGVSIELDRVTSSGAIVSGTVTFSDGVTAKWSLDQAGRLALQASKPGYRPSQEDVQSFQMVLSRKLQERGF